MLTWRMVVKQQGCKRVRVAGTTQSRFTEMICARLWTVIWLISCWRLCPLQKFSLSRGPTQTLKSLQQFGWMTQQIFGWAEARHMNLNLLFPFAQHVWIVWNLFQIWVYMQSPSTTICIRIIALWRSTPVLGTKHRPKVLDIFLKSLILRLR